MRSLPEEDAALIGLELEFIEHPQGGVKKGKPTDAMKKALKEADPPREAEGLWDAWFDPRARGRPARGAAAAPAKLGSYIGHVVGSLR